MAGAGDELLGWTWIDLWPGRHRHGDIHHHWQRSTCAHRCCAASECSAVRSGRVRRCTFPAARTGCPWSREACGPGTVASVSSTRDAVLRVHLRHLLRALRPGRDDCFQHRSRIWYQQRGRLYHEHPGDESSDSSWLQRPAGFGLHHLRPRCWTICCRCGWDAPMADPSTDVWRKDGFLQLSPYGRANER